MFRILILYQIDKENIAGNNGANGEFNSSLVFLIFEDISQSHNVKQYEAFRFSLKKRW